MGDYDPDYPRYSYDEIIDYQEQVAELEALRRWVMVLRNEYPWNRKKVDLVEVARLRDDDYVVVYGPHDREVEPFIAHVTKPGKVPDRLRAAGAGNRHAGAPARPYPAIDVRSGFAV